MKIAIIGFGLEGQAAYDYWHGENEITICDQNPNITVPEGVATQLGPDYLANLDRFDLIVRSPFVRPDSLIAANSVDIVPKVTSNTNEFLRVCPSRNIIGITGTKGKGTTSSLVARILEAAGFRVHLGGNIGVAPLQLLKADIKPDDYVVLELSNFQLIDLKQSPHIAACLMIAPEHLDWHTNDQEYYAAKQQLFRWQAPEDVAVYYSANARSTEIAGVGAAVKIPYGEVPGAHVADDNVVIDDQIICRTDELKLLGKHNQQNVCAAVTVAWNVTHDVQAIHEAVTSFSGLEYRLEPVRTVKGVTYYNDSFGTTPETAIVAIQAFDQPKVVILGGSDKGASYDELARTVAEANIRKVLLIGDQASRIQAALEQAGVTNFQPGGDTMTEIVNTAASVAQSGDVVLLSTGCASFGMFKNYKDRGNQFKSTVQSLA